MDFLTAGLEFGDEAARRTALARVKSRVRPSQYVSITGAPGVAKAAAKAPAGETAAQRYWRSVGVDVDDPELAAMRSFAELETRFRVPSAPRLLENLRRCGWERPSLPQQALVPALLAGRDAVVAAPTGSGKTGAYLLALLARGEPYVVVTLTETLRRQCAAAAAALGRGLGVEGLFFTVKALPGAATPPRFNLVLDEADELFARHGRALGAFLAARRAAGAVGALAALSATVGARARLRAHGCALQAVTVRARPAAALRHRFVYVGAEAHRGFALRQFLAAQEPPVVVFADERALAALRPALKSFSAVFVGNTDTEREVAAALRAFARGRAWVLVATDRLARGVDLRGVRAVAHYSAPASAALYFHRAGRAGRQEPGDSVAFYAAADRRGVYARVVRALRARGERVEGWFDGGDGERGVGVDGGAGVGSDAGAWAGDAAEPEAGGE